MRPPAAVRLAPALAGLLVLAGCTNIDYYAQSVSGHLDVMTRAQPIPAVVADPATPARVKERLGQALAIREFASRELKLPDNASYTRYADLERPYVVWNVFATPELSVKLKEWCFPVAGCVSYRGYYQEDDARAFAAELKAQGYDVLVRGVPAYSTLGWFDDPVLNTVIRYPEPEVARLVFHELAHQVAYVKDDSVFNESFATAVEEEGMRRWLAARGSDELRASYMATRERRREFVALVLAYRDRLDVVYRSDLGVEAKRAEKRRLTGELKAQYQGLRSRWGGFAGYDRWFAEELTNAHLASVAAYTQLVPAFERLLADNGGDLARFYGAVKRLAAGDKAARRAALAPGAVASDAGAAPPGAGLPAAAAAPR
ncbi:MAG: aminopeptidase [Pseudomonadota bacterium]